jgi:hypothetical protein
MRDQRKRVVLRYKPYGHWIAAATAFVGNYKVVAAVLKRFSVKFTRDVIWIPGKTVKVWKIQIGFILFGVSRETTVSEWKKQLYR